MDLLDCSWVFLYNDDSAVATVAVVVNSIKLFPPLLLMF